MLVSKSQEEDVTLAMLLARNTSPRTPADTMSGVTTLLVTSGRAGTHGCPAHWWLDRPSRVENHPGPWLPVRPTCPDVRLLQPTMG